MLLEMGLEEGEEKKAHQIWILNASGSRCSGGVLLAKGEQGRIQASANGGGGDGMSDV